jgi:PPE-repeat protein
MKKQTIVLGATGIILAGALSVFGIATANVDSAPTQKSVSVSTEPVENAVIPEPTVAPAPEAVAPIEAPAAPAVEPAPAPAPPPPAPLSKCPAGTVAGAVDGAGNESNCSATNNEGQQCVAYDDANNCTAYYKP